ncbi:MAG TPA: PH domain-containing protein, partial [Pirellulales bacterium]|nr:PH domain-containing protein [Pirellulales bacterium]
ALFFRNLAPWNCRRYRLTNRRVLVELGLHAKPERSLDLDNFDTIEVVVLPGQEWYPAGDLIFRRGTLETLRLSGIIRPEPFRQTCLKAHRAFVAVKLAVAQQSH